MSDLNETMSFGRVVISDGNGNVTVLADQDAYGYVPETVYQYLDGDGQCIDDEYHELPDGWSLLSGFSGQHDYSGPCMHVSEYVGGGLERHIRETAGLYVTLVVDGLYSDDDEHDDEDTTIGWAIAYRETA